MGKPKKENVLNTKIQITYKISNVWEYNNFSCPKKIDL